jgi:hypothetical protein
MSDLGKTGDASVGGAGPLYPRQQTSSGRPGMSVKCQHRKSALLFDHLVGTTK